MTFENYLFLIPIIAGPIFIIAGIFMLVFPPTKINSFYGYRTPSSKKNQERWNFAQKYSSIELIKLGVVLTLCALIGIIFHPSDKIATLLGFGLLILIIILLFVKVEKAINKKFGKKTE